MASKQSIAVTREAELNRITAGATALADRFGIDVPDFPARGKDPELLRNEQFRWVADTLGIVDTAASRLMKPAKALSPQKTANAAPGATEDAL